jgi:hypothetical protein
MPIKCVQLHGEELRRLKGINCRKLGICSEDINEAMLSAIHYSAVGRPALSIWLAASMVQFVPWKLGQMLYAHCCRAIVKGFYYDGSTVDTARHKEVGSKSILM